MREQLEISEEAWADMNTDHNIALNVELHEFINACHKAWKYWKRKDMNRADVLDEAIDVIHFSMLMFNKSHLDTQTLASTIASEMDFLNPLNDRMEVKLLMADLSIHGYTVLNKFGSILQILDYYGFTTLDILSAYNKKNKVNFERLNNGY